MKKKTLTLLATFLISILALSACGNSEEGKKEDDSSKNDAAETEEPATNPEEDEDEEESEVDKSASDFSDLISYMEEKTEGTTRVLYENKDPQIHTMEDISVSLDAYTLVELNDFHADYEIPFKDQTDGGVILAKYTVKNDSDEDTFYMPTLDITVTYDGVEVYHRNYDALIPKADQLDTKLSHATDYLLPAGEEIIGYVAYPFGKAQWDAALEKSTVDVLVPTAQSDMEDYETIIGSEGRFTMALSDDGAESVVNNSKFYEDRVTFENMGEKKMLKEKNDIGESQELGDATVTLEGYQFTEFTPNTEEAPSFSSFANGIVLLTVKFDLTNKGSENIELSGNSKLTVNDGSQYLLNEGLLLKSGSNRDVVKPESEGEYLQVFVLDKEQYEKIWKEKDFEVEVGPFKNEEGEDISKVKRVTFTLSN